ncbi:helix-turn-helix transcriptional regulator [Salipaludibacillus sp. LMS25]|uniref:helix-turn-helix transcriptional regulator n=1 Tax=Salipaludibacillus sp. LMS25 TaxID=2924031 RepID=UPI0020D03852|nr:helix-turn-helix transcriptional regulator [Salipaludibacillus sp. LMS25]UTR13893.1 helix-turn-helix transcriptional regulator [Salipaludibacillus sp. LMS25]
MDIGKRIRYYRQLKGFTQTDLCKGIVSPSHYSNIESGRYDASYDILRLLALRLQVPTDYFTHHDHYSMRVEKLLGAYQLSLENTLAEAEAFRAKHEQDFAFIPSLEQELQYLLIQCHHSLRRLDLEEADNIYKHIVFYMEDFHESNLSKSTRFDYHFVIGFRYYLNRNYSKSYFHYSQALKFASRDNDIGRIHLNCAQLFFFMNDNYRALFYIDEAKDIFENVNKLSKTIDCLIVKGQILTELKDYKEANLTLQNGLTTARDHGYIREESDLLHTLGILKVNERDYNTSIIYFKESLAIREREIARKNANFVSNHRYFPYYWLIKSYLLAGRYKEMKEHLQKSSDYCFREQHHYELLVLEAKLDYELGNEKDYEEKAEKAIDYLFSHELWEFVEEAITDFSNYYSKKRQYKKANAYLRMEVEVYKNAYVRRD